MLKWVVHCEAVGDGQAVMKYLGAYVFRVAISDARIEAYDGQQVTFKYQYETLRGQFPKVKPPEKPKPLRCPRCRTVMEWTAFLPPRRQACAT